ncbi:MAG: universal stress protein [Bacteriovoracia bacterium]
MNTRTPLIVWAVDPFEPETQIGLEELKLVKFWANARGAALLPVYVASPPGHLLEEGRVDEVKTFVKGMQSAVQSYLQRLGAESYSTPQILINAKGTTREAAESLLHFVAQEDVQVILVSTRGKAGLARSLFGSFAETLVAQANVPIFFLAHASTIDRPADRECTRILFATDFSKNSHRTFQTLLRRLPEVDASCAHSIHIFHAFTYPTLAASGMAMMGATPQVPEAFIEEQKNLLTAEGSQWVHEAQAAGIAADFRLFDRLGGLDTAEAILEAATQAKCNWIAMAAESGPLKAGLLGSVARGVFRAHRFPVWICGPTLLREDSPRNSFLTTPGAMLI